MTTYQLAKVAFSVQGTGPVVDALRTEFAPLSTDDASQPDLRFRFVDRLPDLGTYLAIPPVKAAQDAYEASHGGITYQVRPDGKGYEVLLEAEHNTGGADDGLAGRWRRFNDWNYLSRPETIAKNFLYDVFDHLSQLVHLRRGATYLHASSFERGDRAVAVVAWGGIGKTTSVLKLVTEDRWRFLSDDLGLIDTDGRLWRTPKKMQIYAYNLEGQPLLRERLLGGRSPIDRASWGCRRALKGRKGVRRRVSAEEFFGEELVGGSAPLTDLIFIERANVADFECHSRTIDQVVDQSAVILLDELAPFVEHATPLHSGDFPAILPRPDQMYEQTRSVLREAFAGQDPRLIRIPLDAGPDALADYLREVLADAR